MSAKFCDVFSDVLTLQLTNAFSDTTLKTCDIDTENRVIYLEIETETYIKKQYTDAFVNCIKKALNLKKVTVNYVYLNDCFCKQACIDVAEKLSFKLSFINGFLNNANFNLNGENLDIELKNGGYDVIERTGFVKEFKKEVLSIFNKNVEITFSGVLKTEEVLPPPEEPVFEYEYPIPEEPVFEEPQVFEETSDLPEFLSDVTLFYGKNLDTRRTSLNMINKPTEMGQKVLVSGWGEVFGYEEKNINTKRGPKVVVSFCLSDGTDSVFCKMFMDPEKMETIKKVKNGNIIVFSGSYSFDNFIHDYVLEPKAMATAVKSKKTDNAKEKRVELHCHTNMSMKDAVCSAQGVINKAFEYGHKAIAITDHGVVQSYPAAAAAVSKIQKNGGDFKLIYGVEAYFADDTKGETDITKLSRYHQIILVKDLVGLKNLYMLVSKAHIDDFYKRPITRKSELLKHREGLIIGSACEAGELYTAVVDGKSDEELLEIAKFYDYLEIQPISNNEFMVRDSGKPDKVNKKGIITPNRFKHVTSEEVIKNFNRKIVEIADKLSLPVVATGDVHFLNEEDAIIRKILLAAQGFADFDHQATLFLKTTDEMLKEFEYFGERAKEFVVDNPNKIADMVDGSVIPVPKGNYPPVIEGSDDLLRKTCWDRAMSMYGYKGEIPPVVKDRLATELEGVISNGYSIMYVSAQKLVSFSEENGYLVGSRGSVGSSFVATMAGVSEVNPLPPHYYCPKCKYSEFFSSKDVGSGFDLPEKNCPICGTPYKRDGHDIPFATFLGFKGDKVPDIDLNFSDEFQTEVQKYTEKMFGRENVFKAGTISTIAEKTAFGFVKAYCEEKGITLSQAEINRLAKLVEKSEIKATSGQHPAGMVIVPRDKTIYDFCPIQHPADDQNSDVLTTHFDFHSIHDTILKLDELGHVVPTTYKYLEEYSGISVNDISMSDPKVYSLFTSTEALGVTPEDIFSQTGTFCVPEFGTNFVRGMLVDCQPKCFSDLLQISGLSHGTDVWLGNAKELIDNGTCTIANVIGTRDNIMVYLINQGMENGRAFKITETVRKGLIAKGAVSKEDWEAMENDMRAVGVPEWYIASCKKIKYMFPKAHAAAYVISALRLAWYKVYKPLEFYCAYFTARPEDVEIDVIIKGRGAVVAAINAIKQKGKEASAKELSVLDNLYIFNEILARGIEILPVDLNKSHAVKYLPENGKMRLPFGAISGMGDKAAFAVYETAQKGNFISKEDFQMESGVTKAVMQSLNDLGVLDSIPDTNQMSMF